MNSIHRTILTMRRWTGWAVTLVVGLVFALGAGAGNAVHAQPLVPATFYGAVVVNGGTVPDGTEVVAYIGGTDCTQRGNFYRGTAEADGVSQYSIEVVHDSQRHGCGSDGAEVRFEVGGHPADQVAEWRSGPQRLDLTLQMPEGTSLPTPVPRSDPDAERPSNNPPDADDITPGSGRSEAPEDIQDSADAPAQGQAQGGDDTANSGSGDDTNDGGVAVWLIAIVVVVIVIGVIAGWIIAGRRHLS